MPMYSSCLMHESEGRQRYNAILHSIQGSAPLPWFTSRFSRSIDRDIVPRFSFLSLNHDRPLLLIREILCRYLSISEFIKHICTFMEILYNVQILTVRVIHHFSELFSDPDEINLKISCFVCRIFIREREIIERYNQFSEMINFLLFHRAIQKFNLDYTDDRLFCRATQINVAICKQTCCTDRYNKMQDEF